MQSHRKEKSVKTNKKVSLKDSNSNSSSAKGNSIDIFLIKKVLVKVNLKMKVSV